MRDYTNKHIRLCITLGVIALGKLEYISKLVSNQCREEVKIILKAEMLIAAIKIEKTSSKNIKSHVNEILSDLRRLQNIKKITNVKKIY